MSHLLKSVEDGVMKITLNRPDAMNALSRDMLNSLTDALHEAAGSRDIGCVVVRGAGDKALLRRRRREVDGGRPRPGRRPTRTRSTTSASACTSPSYCTRWASPPSPW